MSKKTFLSTITYPNPKRTHSLKNDWNLDLPLSNNFLFIEHVIRVYCRVWCWALPAYLLMIWFSVREPIRPNWKETQSMKPVLLRHPSAVSFVPFVDNIFHHIKPNSDHSLTNKEKLDKSEQGCVRRWHTIRTPSKTGSGFGLWRTTSGDNQCQPSSRLKCFLTGHFHTVLISLVCSELIYWTISSTAQDISAALCSKTRLIRSSNLVTPGPNCTSLCSYPSETKTETKTLKSG